MKLILIFLFVLSKAIATCGGPIFGQENKHFSKVTHHNHVRLMKDMENSEINFEHLKKIPLVHRMSKKKFISTLKDGLILSTRDLLKKQRKTETLTPGIEDKLFHALDCVFLTAGPLKGRKRYGEIILRFSSESLSTAWATPSSGWFIAEMNREKSLTELQKIMRRQAYGSSSWDDYFRWHILRKTKNDPLFLETLAKASYTKFWYLIDHYKLGYLEVKSPHSLKLEEALEIEMSAQDFEELADSVDLSLYLKKIKII